MLAVGLTGGLASGKSLVGRELERLGCKVIRADDLGHLAIAPGGPAYDDVVREFGPGILGPDGVIDRKRLAAIVFDQSHPERLERLNTLIHPHVFHMEDEQMEAFARENPTGIVVVEAAIMLETGSYRRYQKLIVAVCPEETQIERAMHRDGVTREEALARLRRQAPLAEKARLADYVIDTSGTKENTLRQTQDVHRALHTIATGG